MQSPAGIKRLERSFRRLRLLVCGCIYEVTTPRYARFCFVAHVETRSAPNSISQFYSQCGAGVGNQKPGDLRRPTRPGSLRFQWLQRLDDALHRFGVRHAAPYDADARAAQWGVGNTGVAAVPLCDALDDGKSQARAAGIAAAAFVDSRKGYE